MAQESTEKTLLESEKNRRLVEIATAIIYQIDKNGKLIKSPSYKNKLS